MGLKANLDTRAYRCCGVLNVPTDSEYNIDSLLGAFVQYCIDTNYIIDWYCIKHDDEKTLHIHFIIVSSQQKRLLTYMNDIARGLSFKDNKCIEIDKVKDLNTSIRYLVHMGFEGKKQYSIHDIHSNISFEMLCEHINNSVSREKLNVKELFIVCLKYPNKADLMFVLGLDLFHKYRIEINTLYDNHGYLDAKYSYLLNDVNDLPF